MSASGAGSLGTRIWTSATAMTWMNLGTRVASVLLVLPLILRTFAPGDIALYYLFSSAMALQLLTTAGFVATFARFVSYAFAGVSADELAHGGTRSVDSPPRAADPAVLARLVGTLRRVFGVLSVVTLPLVILAGTWLLRRPMTFSTDPSRAWWAWIAVVLGGTVALYGTGFSAILQGGDRIALEQRWAAFFNLGTVGANFLTLALGGDLLWLVGMQQAGQVANTLRLGWLARQFLRAGPFDPREVRYDTRIFHAIWPASWRSVAGSMMSNGVASLAGLLFAQRLPATPLAEFLLAQRLMGFIGDACRAPFYTKLPSLNRLRAAGDLASLRDVALRGMRWSYLTFLGPFLLLPLVAPTLLPAIGSSIGFPPLDFWILLGAAVLVERWGAMHIQLYSTTNDIIWHWLNGLTGLLWIALLLALTPFLGLHAYPAAMLVAYLAIYTNISVRRSLRSLGGDGAGFEQRAFAPAAVVFLLGISVIWALD